MEKKERALSDAIVAAVLQRTQPYFDAAIAREKAKQAKFKKEATNG